MLFPWRTNAAMEAPYKPVRALERGLDLLIALNALGRARPGQLAAACGLDRTTVYRLLHTLARRGLVARSPAEDSYYLLRDVHLLSDGYLETDHVLHLAARELGRMLPRVQWPSDFAAFDSGAMVIRETTHRFSAFSIHRNMVGRRRSLTNSALGRAVLAVAGESEREMMLQLAEATDGRKRPRDLSALFTDFAERGYAWSAGGTEPHISAVALPIRGPERVLGAVNIVFFRRAATPEQIAEKHLDQLRACVAAIEAGIAAPASEE